MPYAVIRQRCSTCGRETEVYIEGAFSSEKEYTYTCSACSKEIRFRSGGGETRASLMPGLERALPVPESTS